jgi:hypothetical protein
MKTAGNNTIKKDNSTDGTQIHISVDGYKVRLNFPANPEGSAISDIKRMMLGGAVKT